MPVVINAIEAEKEELQWLLTSGALGRSNNLARMLTFICEKHFEGQEDQIKEYNIAVEALGRRSDFDAHIDTIVRVTTHSLRKRLQEIYQNEGANRPVQIQIPSGHYIPSFIHRDAESSSLPYRNGASISTVPPTPHAETASPADHAHRRRYFWLAVALVAIATTLAGVYGWKHTAMHSVEAPPTRVAQPEAQGARDAVRALVGTDRQSYVDRSGKMWTPGPWCKGGSSFTVPSDHKIAGTEDPYLYLGGIRGISHCVFPVKPGMYEVHLMFAETSDLQEATRYVVFSVNGSEATNLDVVDDAAGDDIATSRILKAVQPESDGTIHVDFISEDSMLNAVEILPTPTADILPVRIVTSPNPYLDNANHLWLSDRYFIGGRRGQLPDSAKIADAGMYGSDRIGHFRYIIPVVPQGKYRVRLFFLEPWFGKQNGGSGGVGSRIFDVSCNGNTLLTNFDILSEGGSGPVVKTFDNIQPTAQGKIELYFTPVTNYPLVNAIEVIPESSR